MARKSSGVITETRISGLATIITSWARAARMQRESTGAAANEFCPGSSLETEPDPGGQHIRPWLQTARICAGVVAECGSVEEVAFQLGVKIIVEIPAT